jgi:hypothetical protein
MGWGQRTADATNQADATSMPEYAVDVNKGSLSHLTLTGTLNKRAKDGWRLHTIFEQHGNTVVVYERWR